MLTFEGRNENALHTTRGLAKVGQDVGTIGIGKHPSISSSRTNNIGLFFLNINKIFSINIGSGQKEY